MRIVAEDATNSLIVRATDADWALVQQVLQSVDLRPLQVLIEVTIVQVQRTHDLNLGISGTQTQKNRSGGLDTTLKFASQARRERHRRPAHRRQGRGELRRRDQRAADARRREGALAAR